MKSSRNRPGSQNNEGFPPFLSTPVHLLMRSCSATGGDGRGGGGGGVAHSLNLTWGEGVYIEKRKIKGGCGGVDQYERLLGEKCH